MLLPAPGFFTPAQADPVKFEIFVDLITTHLNQIVENSIALGIKSE